MRSRRWRLILLDTMNKNVFLILGLMVLSSVMVSALTEADIVFPVAELGGCESEEACKTYCDDVANVEACLDFAETYNLMPQEEIAEARIILPLLLSGETPGGCQSEQECDAYCDRDENFLECVEFAKKVGFISDEDYEMAKKTGGKGPGGCKRDECDTYCDKEENFLVCVEFARENGLISDEDYEMAKKTGGKGPGGCQGKEDCDAYCADNVKECMDFMTEHDLFSDEDRARMDSMSDDEKCMLDCMIDAGLMPGVDCGDGFGGSGCDVCAEGCFDFSEQQRPRDDDMADIPDDQRCMAECMLDSGLVPGEDCSGGVGEPGCDVCVERCFDTSEQQQPSGESGASDIPDDQLCMAQCMVNKGLVPGQDCAGGTGSADCDACMNQCFEAPQEPEQPADPEPSVDVSSDSVDESSDETQASEGATDETASTDNTDSSDESVVE